MLREVLVVLAFLSIFNFLVRDETTFWIDLGIVDVNRLTISDLPSNEEERELIKDLLTDDISKNWQPIIFLNEDGLRLNIFDTVHEYPKMKDQGYFDHKLTFAKNLMAKDPQRARFFQVDNLQCLFSQIKWRQAYTGYPMVDMRSYRNAWTFNNFESVFLKLSDQRNEPIKCINCDDYIGFTRGLNFTNF